MKTRLLFLLLLFLCSEQCKTAAKQQSDAKPVFSLFRTACFGTCPSYKIDVFANKQVVYEGLLHTEHLGKKTATISSTEYISLKKKYETLSIEGYANFYPIDVPVPQDIPSIILVSNLSGKEKKIEIKSGAPEALKEWIEELEKLKMSVLSKSNATNTK